MSVLIVHESMFGNTQRVAAAIAEGVREGRAPEDPEGVRLVSVDAAPTTLGDDVTLLIVGGPTHAFGMSRPNTRADAISQGAPLGTTTGIREWIQAVGVRPGLSVITFDTRVHVHMLPGSAAKMSAKALRDRGFDSTERGETFWVEGTKGPLEQGELERARAWGNTLAHLPAATAL
ncbi:flavodoxin [Intrasporangium oryzae NRRL B-24470]|uniref:Flavodoxin n=2 Tax=Intrasporangium TaxID=53357 RepID=W9GB42_9MICO|nr:flavodoxin [Intrasporangium oryzae NRRL B-24470]